MPLTVELSHATPGTAPKRLLHMYGVESAGVIKDEREALLASDTPGGHVKVRLFYLMARARQPQLHALTCCKGGLVSTARVSRGIKIKQRMSTSRGTGHEMNRLIRPCSSI